MTPFEFGQLVGNEKTAGMLSGIATGLQNYGRGLAFGGAKNLYRAANPAMQGTREGLRMAMPMVHMGQTMANRALTNPMKLLAGPSVGQYRSAVTGQMKQMAGGALSGLGKFVGQFAG